MIVISSYPLSIPNQKCPFCFVNTAEYHGYFIVHEKDSAMTFRTDIEAVLIHEIRCFECDKSPFISTPSYTSHSLGTTTVGSICFTKHKSLTNGTPNSIYVQMIYVEKQYRKIGLGRLLISRMLRADPCARVDTLVSSCFLAEGKDFWKKFGRLTLGDSQTNEQVILEKKTVLALKKRSTDSDCNVAERAAMIYCSSLHDIKNFD